MPRLIAYEFLSLDGKFDGPAGREMDFVTSRFTSDIEEDIAHQYEDIGAFVMGRTTFDRLAAYWPTPAAVHERLVDYMNSRRKLVFSSDCDVSAWAHAEHLGTNPMEVLAQRKKTADRDMMIIGSGRVLRDLSTAGMVDEYRFLMFPVVLGAGRGLFDGFTSSLSLELKREHLFDNGVIATTYIPST